MYHGVKVLDVHSHIRPPATSRSFWYNVSAAGEKSMFSPTPPQSPIAGGKHSDLPGLRDEDIQAAADSHAKYLEDRSIDTQIIGPHPHAMFGWFGSVAPHRFKSWIRFSNDLVFRTVQARPDRFLGACHLPQLVSEPDTKHCLEELERCVREYGFVGAYVTPDVTGRRDTPGMHEPYWFPLYEKCQELEVPIIVHGTESLDPRLAGVPDKPYQLTFVTEQYIALACLRQNDWLFKQFPGLKIIICHCGGALDRHIGDYSWLCKDKDINNNLFYDTCAYDTDFLATAIKQRGIAQMVFGSEGPGGGSNRRPGTDRTADDMVPMFESDPALSFLTEADKLYILHEHPKKLFPGMEDSVALNARASVSV